MVHNGSVLNIIIIVATVITVIIMHHHHPHQVLEKFAGAVAPS